MARAAIRRLTERDIGAAIRLTDLESWGYTRADFLRLLALSPEGCFAAVASGEVIGVLTTTSYGSLAFLGAVIVAPSHRGTGIGKAMMSAALEHLSREGVRTVRLNAYLNVVSFYESLGFRREYEVVRWHGTPHHAASDSVRPAMPPDVPAIVALDEAHFGVPRKGLIERLLAEFPQTFWVAEDDGDLVGYIVGNPGADACEIGPWVVHPSHGDLARALCGSVVRSSGASTFAFAGPHENRELADFVREERLREVFRTLRMCRGEDAHAGDPHGVWALAGLEKG